MENHRGQCKGWKATKRFLILLAGWQSGKTDFGVEWCFRACGRYGPGEALVLAPSHPLLIRATQKRLVKRFTDEGLATPNKGDNFLLVPEATLRRMGWKGKPGDLTIFFGHTQTADVVEATSAVWIWADECGQMSDDVAIAIKGRVSHTRGPVLYTSRPYYDNWYRESAENPDELTEVVTFASWDCPGHDAGYIALQKSQLPKWKFDMRFGGVFTRPAGAIYDCYVDKLWDDPEEPGHLETSFEVPADWERVYGIDFGSVHTAVRCYAKDPVLKAPNGMPLWHNYRTYFPNQSRSVSQHVRILREAEPPGVDWPPLAFGGNAGSEQETRDHWALAGLPVAQPMVSSVEAGIDVVYACTVNHQIRYFDTLKQARSQKRRYSWKVDDNGDPIPGEIEAKKVWHLEDAERYAAPYFAAPECGQMSRVKKEKKFVPTETHDRPPEERT